MLIKRGANKDMEKSVEFGSLYGLKHAPKLI